MDTTKLDELEEQRTRLSSQLSEVREAIQGECDRLAVEVSPFAVGDVLRKGKRRFRVDTIVGGLWGSVGKYPYVRAVLCTNVRADGSLGAKTTLYRYEFSHVELVREET